MYISARARLLATTLFVTLGSTSAFAQQAADPAVTETTALQAADQATEDTGEDIVVTGSLFRRTDTETPSPVTVLSAESLQQRGINTVADAVQRVSANGAGTITQGWNVGTNFATGANAISLRGLSVQSTLTVFDGLRMAPYPLADDGRRNFVDLNTIPNAIIERIEVLRDGASSTYGADAVAGVINVITKKQVQGVHLNGSAGISERGDAAEQRIDATIGYGDLDEQGFNFYVSGEYQRNEALSASDRGYPFNTTDFSRDCAPSIGRPEIRDDDGNVIQTPIAAGTITCRPNGTANSIQPNGSFNGLLATPVPVVRQVDAVGDPLGQFNILNAADGCRDLTPVNVPGDGPASSRGTVQCSLNIREKYRQILPEQERMGGAVRFTAKVGDSAEVYAMANYYKVDTRTQREPGTFAGTTPNPTAVTLNPVYLPVYVCPTGVGSPSMLDTGCDATNGTLNPNNPFAAQGDRAQLLAAYDRTREIESHARSLRGALGISGSFGDGWNYSAEFTASNVQLDVTNRNVLIPGRILDVIADGSYNFVNPELNSQEVRDYIAPESKNRSTSDLWQGSVTLSKTLFDLPGGPLQAAVGASYRHESIDNPSANPANEANPFDRYYIINAVGAIGSRNVKSAFGEINAPILEMLEVNLSGRYDDYSSGQSNFSPKIGAKFTPIRQLAIRGTYSKGFRIPSFNESFGLPTTGFVTRSLGPDVPGYNAFVAAHGGNTYATNPFAVGLTSIGNPDLEPEKSTSWTLGAIIEPIRNVSFTVDYWNIEIDDIIVSATYEVADVFAEYYSNNGVVNIPGVIVTPGIADVNFPNALPHIGFIESSYDNADTQRISGIDIGANVRLPVTDGLTLNSSFEASYVIKYEKVLENRTERYDGTLSPCDVTSCSGQPKWRATWQNTVELNDTTITATAYYTGGYDLASIDYGGVKGDCLGSRGGSVVTYQDNVTPVLCEASATWNVDLTLNQRIDDRFTIYANILNVLGIDPPFDPSAAYSQGQYNPAWAGANILGRYFRIGAKVDF